MASRGAQQRLTVDEAVAIAGAAALSHGRGGPDEQYWARVAVNRVARAVKLADIEDNSNPERLARLEPHDRERLTAKYARALQVLGALSPG